MPISPNLRGLIDANAPLWAGEAEIARTYWTSPVRTRATDKLWLKRQCWKEYVGSAKDPGRPTVELAMCTGLARDLEEQVPQLDITVDRHDLRDLFEKVFAEFTHYCLFADVYDSLLAPGEPRIRANELAIWPEEDALAKYRQGIRSGHGKLARASGFTEGGYCTLYSEGARLKGRAGVDGRIGNACQKVYDDEFGHMMWGVIGTDMDDLTQADWKELTEVTCEILRLRLFMRNSQFSHPVSTERMAEILAGKIEPIAFDYAKAETYLVSGHAAAAQ
ncbi:MAG TPA: hypothetical protein VL993_15300 [Stellaceae bacterium]|nr:hypothetical protein [Stellaceae bacterium]